MDFTLDPHLSSERQFIVEEHHIAKFLGTGDIAVLSTPSMIMFMEHTCRLAADEQLQDPYTTVGVRVDVSHLAPAPRGAIVKIEVKLKNQDGRKLTFEVVAWWKNTKIGEGTHERFIIDRNQFIKKLKTQSQTS